MSSHDTFCLLLDGHYDSDFSQVFSRNDEWDTHLVFYVLTVY